MWRVRVGRSEAGLGDGDVAVCEGAGVIDLDDTGVDDPKGIISGWGLAIGSWEMAGGD